MSTDQRRFAPSAARNRDPILAVLRRHLPQTGLVLEIASGTGEHVVHFATALPQLEFQPSDPDLEARQSVDSWAGDAGLPNVWPALALDVRSASWPIDRADAVLCINMVHISPWAATGGLMRGAARCLAPGGLLVLYGPFRQNGQHTADSNAEFDADLRLRNPEWGVRDLEAVVALAQQNGFGGPTIEPMPANNLTLFFRKL